LYFADKVNTVLHLDYRYNPIPIGPNSSIQFKANGAYLGSVPLVPGKEATKQSQTDMALPVVDLRPFSNSLWFNYTFQIQKGGGCKDTTPINMQGSILRTSYLDLRGFAHWAALPSLDLFANAGFPFTRFADLSDTTVILPERPTAQEIEVYLTLLGHFGAQTGFPVLRVSVGSADEMKPGADRDFLVIGTGDDNAGITKASSNMPVLITPDGLKVQDTEGFFAPLHRAWWKIKSIDHQVSGELGITGVPDTILEGLESPFSSKRTVVLINLKDAASAGPFLTSFLKVSQSGDISGTVSVLHGTDFQSYRIGNSVYHVGYLPWWEAIDIWFTEVPWTVALGVLAVSFFFAIWIRAWLRQKARARLQVYHS
jgi:cellulose synthase (UDP-forming)